MAKHTLWEWIWAARPWSLPASSMPVIATLGFLFWWKATVAPEMPCNWFHGVLALVGMMTFQASANLISDYFDFIYGVDAPDTFGSRTILSGKFTPRETLIYGFTLWALGILIGLVLLWRTKDTRLFWLGFCGVFFAACYPFFKFRALGDLLIFTAFSPLPILGTTLVVTGQFLYEALVLAVPVGLITVAILHANNWRDIGSDRRAHIRTFSMLIGSRFSEWVYVTELIFPFLWIAVVACFLPLLPLWSLLVLLALPLSLSNARRAVWRADDVAAIADLDEWTAKLQLVFSLTLSCSFLIAALVQ